MNDKLLLHMQQKFVRPELSRWATMGVDKFVSELQAGQFWATRSFPVMAGCYET